MSGCFRISLPLLLCLLQLHSTACTSIMNKQCLVLERHRRLRNFFSSPRHKVFISLGEAFLSPAIHRSFVGNSIEAEAKRGRCRLSLLLFHPLFFAGGGSSKSRKSFRRRGNERTRLFLIPLSTWSKPNQTFFIEIQRILSSYRKLWIQIGNGSSLDSFQSEQSKQSSTLNRLFGFKSKMRRLKAIKVNCPPENRSRMERRSRHKTFFRKQLPLFNAKVQKKL